MYGDDRRRFCGDCKLNVYNLSGMTRDEAEALLMNAEGRLCVRFFKRADGTVITQDCPVGWAKVKQRTKLYAAALASLVMALFTGVLFVSFFSRKDPVTMGAIAMPLVTPSPTPVRIMGVLSNRTPERSYTEMMGGAPASSYYERKSSNEKSRKASRKGN
jgi:hypothetical protein